MIDKHTETSLNSIMFLLIRFYKLPSLIRYSSLNSIMFLLIPAEIKLIGLLQPPLNSIMFLLIRGTLDGSNGFEGL